MDHMKCLPLLKYFTCIHGIFMQVTGKPSSAPDINSVPTSQYYQVIRFNYNLQYSTPTLFSGGHLKRFAKVCCMFLANRGANTSLSCPNWCRDCRTIESITYKPGTLYSGLHFCMNFSTLCTTCL